MAVPLAQALQLLAVDVHGGPHEGRHGRYGLLRRAVAQRVEPCRERRPLPFEQVPPLDDPGDLRLQPDHRLLQALPRGVAGPGQRLVVFEQRLLLPGEAERGVHVAEVVVGLLDLGDDVSPGRLVEVAERRRFEQRDAPPQLQGAEPRKALGQRDAVELRADPGLHAAQRLGEADDRVGQRGDLRHPLPGGFVMRLRLEDRRIAFDRGVHVGPQLRRDGVEVERILRRRRLRGGERRDQARGGQTGRETGGAPSG